MFTSILKNVVAAAAVLFPVVTAQASDTKDPLAAWVAQVNQQIELRAQPPFREVGGRAVITFRRGTDGRAYDVVARSGQPAVALAGVHTIERLRDLPPLPAGLPANQRIVMNYLVGLPSDPVGITTVREQMLASARKANAEIAAHMDGSQVASVGR